MIVLPGLPGLTVSVYTVSPNLHSHIPTLDLTIPPSVLRRDLLNPFSEVIACGQSRDGGGLTCQRERESIYRGERKEGCMQKETSLLLRHARQ